MNCRLRRVREIPSDGYATHLGSINEGFLEEVASEC